MLKRDRERSIFEAFLATLPTFIGEPLRTSHQPDDEREFPDIVAEAVSGRRVGVELGEWLNEKQMREAKADERLRASILEILGDQEPNTTQHIRFVWLHPRTGVRISPTDAGAFREQVYACIHECDRRWQSEPYWNSPAGALLASADLAAFPVLANYLSGIKLWPWLRRSETRPVRRSRSRPPEGCSFYAFVTVVTQRHEN